MRASVKLDLGIQQSEMSNMQPDTKNQKPRVRTATTSSAAPADSGRRFLSQSGNLFLAIPIHAVCGFNDRRISLNAMRGVARHLLRSERLVARSICRNLSREQMACMLLCGSMSLSLKEQHT